MSAILDLPEMRARVHRWTVADYQQLAEDNPAFRHSELIRGIIIEKMSKSPLHNFLTDKTAAYLRARLRAGLVVRQELSLQLADSVPEPDVAVVRGTREDFRTRHPTTAELVIEVAVSSVAPDRENASLYAEAGVAEYWIILGEEERVEVYRQPENGIYQQKRIYGRGEVIEGMSFMEEALAVETLFA